MPVYVEFSASASVSDAALARLWSEITSDHQEQTVELIRLIRIVLSSFFGVRKRASHEADFANVNIVLLPFVAVFMAACIGAIIFGVVHLVAHSTSSMQGF